MNPPFALAAVLAAPFLVACSGTPASSQERDPEAVDVTASMLALPDEGDACVVTAGSEPFATVHVDGLPKPYVYPLFGPGGVPVTRAYPLAEAPGEERDHPHHVSFWFAHGAVNGFDFWHGSGRGERQESSGGWGLVETEGALSLLVPYTWTTDAGALLREARVLTFRARKDLRSVDVDITLEPAGDAAVTFGDTKEGTFALRLHPALRLAGPVATGTIRNAAGDRDGDCWGKRAAWVEYSGVVDGQAIGVAILDHPENPRHPTWWHARDYGLFAANPFGMHDFEGAPAGSGDFVLAPGETLRLRYRVLIHTGAWSAAELDAAW